MSLPSVDGFLAARSGTWAELDALLRVASLGRLSATRQLRLAELYRASAADLELVRRRYPGHPAAAALEALVAHARDVVLARPRAPTAAALRDTLRRLRPALPALLRAAAPAQLAAASLLLLALGLTAAFAFVDPLAAARTLPAALRRGADGPPIPAGLPRGVPYTTHAWTAGQAALTAVLATALGVTAGLGTVVVLVGLALELGVPVGLALQGGSPLGLPAVTSGQALDGLGQALGAGGLLQLVAVVVAAGQGLSLGRAVIARTPLTAQARPAAGGVVLSAALLAVAAVLGAVAAGSGLARGAAVGWPVTLVVLSALGLASRSVTARG